MALRFEIVGEESPQDRVVRLKLVRNRVGDVALSAISPSGDATYLLKITTSGHLVLIEGIGSDVGIPTTCERGKMVIAEE